MSQFFTRPALLMALLFYNALAISVQPNSQSELDRLVDTLQEKYGKLLPTLAADFTQVYNAPGQPERRESGRLWLKPPGKMRWQYASPQEKLLVSDGGWLYEYVHGEKYATRKWIRETDDPRAPFALLLEQGKLRRDFELIEFADESPAKAGNKVLRLVPKKALRFKELLIEIEPNSLQISRLSVTEPNDARSDFVLSNVRENISAPPGMVFQFSIPPGVEYRDN